MTDLVTGPQVKPNDGGGSALASVNPSGAGVVLPPATAALPGLGMLRDDVLGQLLEAFLDRFLLKRQRPWLLVRLL